MPVKIDGIHEVLASLDLINPAAAKQLDHDVKAAAAPIVARARGYAPAQAPLSGWGKEVGLWRNRAYNVSEVRAGIGFANELTPPNKRGFSYTAYIYNRSAAGAIYETAGRKNPNGRKVAPSVQHYANAGTPNAKADYRVRNNSKLYSQSANPNAGKQFIDSLGQIYKVPRAKGQVGRTGRKQNGRLIFRAWGEDQGRVLGAIAQAYSSVVDRFNKGTLR